MPKTIKFAEDEMKSLRNIQDNYVKIQSNLGQIAVAKLKLEQQIVNLNIEEDRFKSEFSKTQEEEQNFIDTVTEKYGEGSLNPQTGEFTTAN